jgi:hypothetical protein
MGTLYFNEAQMKKYKELNTAEAQAQQQYFRQRDEQQAALSEEIRAMTGGLGSSPMFIKDPEKRAEMEAREDQIEIDAQKLVDDAHARSLEFLNEMKRDTVQQKKLQTSWIARDKVKPSETAAGTEAAEAEPAVDIAAVAAEQAKSGNLLKVPSRTGASTMGDVDKISKIKSELVDLKSKLANAGVRTSEETKDRWKVLIAQKEEKLNTAMGVTPAADLGVTQTLEGAASDATKSVTALSNQTYNQSSTTYAPQTANTNLYPSAQAVDPHTAKQAQHTLYS